MNLTKYSVACAAAILALAGCADTGDAGADQAPSHSAATPQHTTTPSSPAAAPTPAPPPGEPAAEAPHYELHRGIMTTLFWIGEPAAPGSPTNASSAWDPHWVKHFGGVDDPHDRIGYRPATFIPLQNPFYVALPYNDFYRGQRRAAAASTIPWAGTRQWAPQQSMCKGRWLRITRGERTAYAQWEDVGPFRTDDTAYVFGTAPPRNTSNHGAGMDASPGLSEYLGLDGMGRVDWQFVEESQVPAGPWRQWGENERY